MLKLPEQLGGNYVKMAELQEMQALRDERNLERRKQLINEMVNTGKLTAEDGAVLLAEAEGFNMSRTADVVRAEQQGAVSRAELANKQLEDEKAKDIASKKIAEISAINYLDRTNLSQLGDPDLKTEAFRLGLGKQWEDAMKTAMRADFESHKNPGGGFHGEMALIAASWKVNGLASMGSEMLREFESSKANMEMKGDIDSIDVSTILANFQTLNNIWTEAGVPQSTINEKVKAKLATEYQNVSDKRMFVEQVKSSNLSAEIKNSVIEFYNNNEGTVDNKANVEKYIKGIGDKVAKLSRDLAVSFYNGNSLNISGIRSSLESEINRYSELSQKQKNEIATAAMREIFLAAKKQQEDLKSEKETSDEIQQINESIEQRQRKLILKGIQKLAFGIGGLAITSGVLGSLGIGINMLGQQQFWADLFNNSANFVGNFGSEGGKFLFGGGLIGLAAVVPKGIEAWSNWKAQEKPDKDRLKALEEELRSKCVMAQEGAKVAVDTAVANVRGQMESLFSQNKIQKFATF